MEEEEEKEEEEEAEEAEELSLLYAEGSWFVDALHNLQSEP